MTGKEKFYAAIKGELPNDCSLMELEYQLFEELLGEDPIVGNEYQALCASRKKDALKKNAELFVKAAKMLGHDVIRDLCGYWETAPGHPALLWLPTLEDRVDFIRCIKDTVKDEYSILATVCCPFCIPTGEELYTFVDTLYDEPEKVREDFCQKTEDAMRVGDALLEAGADGLINTADVAFNSGTFMTTEHMEELFFPELKRWAEYVHRKNALAIWHTDGNITKVLPFAKESGIDAIQCVDPIAGMDLRESFDLLEGKVALIGNVDCAILQNCTEEEIRNECKRVFNAVRKDDKWVMGCCNAVFKGIPLENYRVFLDEYVACSRRRHE